MFCGNMNCDSYRGKKKLGIVLVGMWLYWFFLVKRQMNKTQSVKRKKRVDGFGVGRVLKIPDGI